MLEQRSVVAEGTMALSKNAKNPSITVEQSVRWVAAILLGRLTAALTTKFPRRQPQTIHSVSPDEEQADILEEAPPSTLCSNLLTGGTAKIIHHGQPRSEGAAVNHHQGVLLDLDVARRTLL